MSTIGPVRPAQPFGLAASAPPLVPPSCTRTPIALIPCFLSTAVHRLTASASSMTSTSAIPAGETSVGSVLDHPDQRHLPPRPGVEDLVGRQHRLAGRLRDHVG